MSWVANLPFFARFSRGVLIEGEEQPQDPKGAMALMNLIDYGYFETLGIPLQGGRDFSRSDIPGSLPIAT